MLTLKPHDPIWTPGALWQGKTAYILGGGSSVNDEPDLGLVPADTLISTNFGILLRPDAAIEIFRDDSFCEMALPELRAFKGTVVTYHGNSATRAHFPEARLFAVQIGGALSTEPGCLCGLFTGHLAINLALQLGAQRIVLLGFDGGQRSPVGAVHFHRRYDSFERPGKYHGWNGMMEDLSRAVPRRFPGVEIVNCSRATALTCFLYQRLKACLP
jgi:hypothetical protein